MQGFQLLAVDVFQAQVHGISTDDFKVLAGGIVLLQQEQPQADELVVVLAGDDRQHVAPQAGVVAVLFLYAVHGGESLAEIVGDAANGVVGVGQAVNGKVQVDHQVRAIFQHAADDAVNLVRQQAVGGEVERADVVVAVKQADDFVQSFAHEGLAAREPQLAEGRCGAGDGFDLLEAQVLVFVQLVPIKAGAAERVAARGDEQEKRVELLGTKNCPRIGSQVFGRARNLHFC